MRNILLKRVAASLESIDQRLGALLDFQKESRDLSAENYKLKIKIAHLEKQAGPKLSLTDQQILEG